MKKLIAILIFLVASSASSQPFGKIRKDKKASREYIKTQIAGDNLKVRMKYSNRTFDKIQEEMTKKGLNSKKIYCIFSSDTLDERAIIWKEETPTVGGKSKPFVYYNISRTDSMSILCILVGN
jgi:hypothetical protein